MYGPGRPLLFLNSAIDITWRRNTRVWLQVSLQMDKDKMVSKRAYLKTLLAARRAVHSHRRPDERYTIG